jgi:hypothetical protein
MPPYRSWLLLSCPLHRPNAYTAGSAFVLGDFKLKHRDAYSMADVGRVLAGRPGEEFFSLAVCICMLFFSASGMVGVTTALNAVSTHGTCTAVFMIVVFIVSFGCATIRTLGNITWLGWVGLMSILSAGELQQA